MEDLQLLALLRAEWSALYDASLYRKMTMEPAKQVFAKTTENLIAEFVNVCELFAAKFREEGPGAEQNDLEQGFNLKIVSSNLYFRIIVIISDKILNTLYYNIIDSFVFS